MSWLCFKRTASKQVYYLGWNRSPAQVGCMRKPNLCNRNQNCRKVFGMLVGVNKLLVKTLKQWDMPRQNQDVVSRKTKIWLEGWEQRRAVDLLINSDQWFDQLDPREESWAPKNWCFWTVVLEKTLESSLDCKEIQPVHPKGDQSWVFIGRTEAETETPVLRSSHVKSWLMEKTLMLGGIGGKRRRGQ